MTRINPDLRREPAPPPAKPKRVSRQASETARKDRQYAKLRLQYLAENPTCVRCGQPANQIHHILRGANRRRGLLNTDTWLACCSIECHDAIELMSWNMQVLLKQSEIRSTVERLRK